MKLSLDDLRPKESVFELSDRPGKQYTLKKFTLATQIWVNQKYGTEKIKAIFENQSIVELSEIIHHMLKDKADFPTVADFQECIVTQGDRVSIMQALLETIGLSQPVLKNLTEQDEGNAESPSQPTGAQSST